MPQPRRKSSVREEMDEDDDRKTKKARSSKTSENSDARRTSSNTNQSDSKLRGISSSHKQQNDISTGTRTKTSSAKTNSSKSSTGIAAWSSESAAFSKKKCHTWFNDYAARSGDQMIDPEGMEKFCEDIGVEPENVVMLVLAYKLKASQMGYFSLEEWLSGMSELQCDSTAKLINKLDYLRCLLSDPSSFKPIYRYAFDFAKESGTRCMTVDIALPMLRLLLGKIWPLFSHFCRFIENSNYKVLNRDQWLNIYEFSLHIQSDLSNYDEDGAWPVMLDEFVNWLRENK